jgi:hypothetical protein
MGVEGLMSNMNPMKRWIFAAVAALSLAACGGEGEAPDSIAAGAFGRLEFAADPLEPPAAGENAFLVTLRDLASDEPVTGASLATTAVMPSMGHVAPEGIIVEEVGGGIYEVKNLVFSMPGRWEVRYRAVKGEITDEAAFRYEVR